MFEQQSWHHFLLSLVQQKRKLQSSLATCARSEAHSVFPSWIQRGKEEYKLAATSDGKEKKGKKGKKGKSDKDMDDLKKEVDLVSTQIKASL